METKLLIITVGQNAFSYVMLALFFVLSFQRLVASGEQKTRKLVNTTETLHFSDIFAQRRFSFSITPSALIIHCTIPTMEEIVVEMRDSNNEILLESRWHAYTNEFQEDWKGLVEEEYTILLRDSCSSKTVKFKLKSKE